MQKDGLKRRRFLMIHRVRFVLDKNRHRGRAVRAARDFAGRFLPPVGDGMVVPTLYGFDMRVNARSDAVLAAGIHRDGTYEAGTCYLLQQCLREGDIMLDIGANIGLMSLVAARQVGPAGQVYAFEPEPGVRAQLTENIRLNGFSNVRVEGTALGASRATLPIYPDRDNPGASTLIPSAGRTEASAEVPVAPLDDYVAEHAVPPIRMIKIDVEGWELEVLKGARQLLSSEKAPILCIECSRLHPMADGTVEDMYRYLLQVNDYAIYRPSSSKSKVSRLVPVSAADELPEHDNIYALRPSQQQELSGLLVRTAGTDGTTERT